jgi:hypothetical protein
MHFVASNQMRDERACKKVAACDGATCRTRHPLGRCAKQMLNGQVAAGARQYFTAQLRVASFAS